MGFILGCGFDFVEGGIGYVEDVLYGFFIF